MKKIAVLSDTHRNVSAIRKIEGILSDADIIFHLGDNSSDMAGFPEYREKLTTVNGNCDLFASASEKIIEVEGTRIMLTHGHAFNVKSGLNELRQYAKEHNVSVVLYGHTHEAMIEEEDGILFVNPGNMTSYSTDKSFCYLVIEGSKAVATINRAAFLS